jgi:hypothetical protein
LETVKINTLSKIVGEARGEVYITDINVVSKKQEVEALDQLPSTYEE